VFKISATGVLAEIKRFKADFDLYSPLIVRSTRNFARNTADLATAVGSWPPLGKTAK
jgi:hypothetical protein